MTTWYVRPDTSHNGTRNGTEYEFAWGGWSAITWGVGGVVGGDTLYVCGAHSYAAIISIGNHGGSSAGTRCEIRGDYSSDPGSITFAAGSYFVNNARAWTAIRELTINAGNNACIFVSDVATDCEYTDNVFVTTASNPFSFSGSNGEDHVRVTIARNVFRGASSITAGLGSAIGWFVTATSAVSTLTDITIDDNEFDGFSASRAVIHFRTEDDTDSASVMRGVTVSRNVFRDCRGVCIEIIHGHALVGIGGRADVYENEAYNCLESAVTAGAGGLCAVGGFARADVYRNRAYGLQGATGFVNAFYGYVRAWDNYGEDLSTTTIDGNGILYDHGASGAAWGNEFHRAFGKSGTFNSGVGIMVLDATNVTCTGNVVVGCKWGVHLGSAGSGQSCLLALNTIVGCTDGAIYATASADLPNCDVEQNVFVGDGYSVYDATATAWSAENRNCFYGFASGTSNHTLGAQSFTTDPLLDASYRPHAGSPCLEAGTRIADVVLKDFYGKDITKTPDIGAVQVYPARAASAARGVITRSASTRTASGRRAAYG